MYKRQGPTGPTGPTGGNLRGDLIIETRTLFTSGLGFNTAVNRPWLGQTITEGVTGYTNGGGRRIQLDFDIIKTKSSLIGWLFEAVTGAGTADDPEVVRDIQFVQLGGGVSFPRYVGNATYIQDDTTRQAINGIVFTSIAEVPTSPTVDQVIFQGFWPSISSGVPSTFKDFDGTTTLTTLPITSIYKWDGTNWVRQRRYKLVYLPTSAFAEIYNLKFSTSNQSLFVVAAFSSSGSTRFNLVHKDPTLPANSKIRMYEAVVGGRGPKGDTGTGLTVWEGTEAAYNALAVKDNNTQYFTTSPTQRKIFKGSILYSSVAV